MSAEEIKQKITEKAANDETFRKALLENPKKAIRDNFEEVPELLPDINICVHVDTPYTIHLVVTQAEVLNRFGY